jgi:hypothetical protein
MSDRVVLINVDENGFEIEPVVIELFDEEGNPTNIPDSKYLVPPASGGFFRPKWDFDNLIWTEGDPVTALNLAKQNKKAQFKAECNAIIDKGFTFNGDVFAFSKLDDQPLFTMRLVYLLADPNDVQIEWKTLNNGVKIFTRDEFISICQEGKRHFTEYTGALWRLEGLISNIETMDELNSLVDFETSRALVQ